MPRCHDVAPISHDVDEPGASAQVVERASGEQDVLRCLLRPPGTCGRDIDPNESAEHPFELELGFQIQGPTVRRLAEGAGLDIDDLNRLSPIRGSYVGPIDGQFVPGYVPIEVIPVGT